MLLLSEFKLLKNIYASKKDLNLGDVKQTYVSRVGKNFTWKESADFSNSRFKSTFEHF